MGKNVKEIKKRIVSVSNTKKITKTMEMVATSKAKRAQERVVRSQPYTAKLWEMIGHLLEHAPEVDLELLKPRTEVRRVLLFVVTANRGLCGGYNANVLKLARDRYREHEEQGRETQIDVVGKKGISFFRFNNIATRGNYTDIDDKLTFEQFEPISQRILDGYMAGGYDEFELIYTKYKSSALQVAVIRRLLPLEMDVGHTETEGYIANYIYEPDAADILRDIIPYAFKMNFYQALLESFTSEHIYRRIAMKSATDAATDMIKSLRLSYNRARQAKITQEIAEIIGGVNALVG